MTVQDHLAFTIEEAERLSALTRGQLAGLARKGVVRPGTDGWNRPLYSFRDLVALRAIARLRNRKDNPVSMQAITRLHDYLQRFHEQPFSALTIAVSGRELAFKNPETGRFETDSPEGQLVITETLELGEVANETKQAIRAARSRTASQIGATSKNREVLRNARVIAGTRIATETIAAYAQAGYSTDRIIEIYPSLSREDVAAAIEAEREAKAAS